jgi:hypothetical protein
MGDTVSSLAIAPGVLPAHRQRSLTAVLSRHSIDILLGVVVACFAIALLAEVPRDFNVDSWLQLVVGREVWQSGIPYRNLLTLTGFGHRWIDEQWLSQLAGYAIYRLGGLGLLGAVNAALLVGSITGGVIVARRRRASFVSVLVGLALCLILIGPSREIRTQEFAMPLFVAVAWLLSADGRDGARTRRVYWCLPLLVLWANLHGSVTLGTGLVVLYSLTLLWQRRALLSRDARAWRRPLMLTAGALAAILVTPYGLQIVSYYHATIVDPDLRRYVTEWQPITTNTPLTATWVALVGLTLWSFARAPARTTLWEKLALIVVAIGALDATRNALFLGLLGLIVLPVALGSDAPSQRLTQAHSRWRLVVNGGCAALAGIGVLVALVATLARPAASIIDARESPGSVAAVRRASAANPSLRVIADDHDSDFLLWQAPALAGHMAADARFELLDGAQLAGLSDVFQDTGPHPMSFARGDRLVVLSRRADRASVDALLAEPGRRILYRDSSSLVILRSTRQAARR